MSQHLKKQNRTKGQTQRVTVSAMLLAVMLVCGWIEHMIPLGVSIPGIKLGLSNGVLIFAVYMLDIPTAYVLMVLKVLLSGFMFSGVSAMMYGLCGGVISLTTMILLSRIRRLPCWAVGIAGGMTHNVGQVMLAVLIAHLPMKVALGYMAWLVGIGGVCGFLTGFCAQQVIRHMRASGMLRSKLFSPYGRGASIAVVAAALLLAGGLAWACYPQIKPADASQDPFVMDDNNTKYTVDLGGQGGWDPLPVLTNAQDQP